MTRSRHAAVLSARRQLTPRTVRLTLSGESLVGFTCRPAQDVEVMVGAGNGLTTKRRYTIREARGAVGEIDLDVVVHQTGGPGSHWARSAALGSPVELVGPCGKLELLPAAWHLLVGDESSLPAIASLCQALGPAADSVAVVEVDSDADQLPLGAAEVRWVTRAGEPAGTVGSLVAALRRHELPRVAECRAYLLGEAGAMRALREQLQGWGLPSDRIFAKGYWRAGGAPDHRRSA